MIDLETQIKIQACLDGELPVAETREITALIARDRDAAALHSELKNTRRTLTSAEQGMRLPESREFYWSKISREIEQSQRTKTIPVQPTAWQILRRWIRPLGAVAVVALVSVLSWSQMGIANNDEFVTALADMDTITFRDDANATTLVWFDQPAENDVALDADWNMLD